MNTTSLVLQNAFIFIYNTAHLWAPVVLAIVAFRVWLWYVREAFFQTLTWTVLEFKVPQEVHKSPMAMEMFLTNALYQGGGLGNWMKQYWAGEQPIWSSLEIASIEGHIHFFARIPTKFKELVESQMYAQYPQVEIFEVADYTKAVPDYTPDGTIDVFGGTLAFDPKADGKKDSWPIKTYIDYGLDKAVGTLEEEQRIDPIIPMIEWMGSLGKGEQAWFQVIIKPAELKRFEIEVADKKDPKKKIKEMSKWTKLAEEEIKAFKAKFVDKEGKPLTMSEQDRRILASLERNATKLGFDAGVVYIYIANKENLNKNQSGNFGNVIRQYNSPELNNFKAVGMTGGKDFIWEDLPGKVPHKGKKNLLRLAKSRDYFYPHFDFKEFKHYVAEISPKLKPMILTTEEIATIYHLPGKVSETPTFKRIESKKAEAPGNLPF